MKENILKVKTFEFAVRMVNLHKYLQKEHGEYIISKQLIRCSTSIGAIIRETEHAESKKDFIHKLTIGLKEANESKYWLEILLATNFLPSNMFESLNQDCEAILKMLISSVKTSKLKKDLPQTDKLSIIN